MSETFLALPDDCAIPSIESASTAYLQYRDVILKLEERLQDAGYDIRGFRADRPSRFTELGIDQQKAITVGLQHYYEVCSSAEREGVDIKNDGRSAAWWVIRSLEWRPSSDVFSFITPDDIIEIYSRGHVQLFRSFNMFRFISYSIDELATHDWPSLYHRPEKDHRRVMALFEQAIDEKRTIVEALGERHIISERFSQRLRRAVYESRVVSPLFSSQNEVTGYINVIRAHDLGMA